MNTEFAHKDFIVDGMLYPGLYIFAGEPKIGKSWMMLDLCLSVAEGQDFLGKRTNKCAVHYLALEDTAERLQNRMFEFTEDAPQELVIDFEADTLGSGLEEQLAAAKEKLPDLRLTVIDTLQKVRGGSESSYSNDYKELSSLKAVADRLGIAIVVVHHFRKEDSTDPFKKISGSTGLTGCADGSFVIDYVNSALKKAKLYGTGRDFESFELNLEFDSYHWLLKDEIVPYKPDMFSAMIHDFMVDELRFVGSATSLCEKLCRRFSKKFYPNHVTRDLIQHTTELASVGVDFENHRSHGARTITLTYTQSGDGKNGALLFLEVEGLTGTRYSAKPETALFSSGDSNSAGDGNCDLGAGNFASGTGKIREGAGKIREGAGKIREGDGNFCGGEVIDVPYEAVSEPADTASAEQLMLLDSTSDTVPQPKPPNPPHIPKRKKKKGRSRHRRR